jgi:hypothetical protein
LSELTSHRTPCPGSGQIPDKLRDRYTIKAAPGRHQALGMLCLQQLEQRFASSSGVRRNRPSISGPCASHGSPPQSLCAAFGSEASVIAAVISRRCRIVRLST